MLRKISLPQHFVSMSAKYFQLKERKSKEILSRKQVRVRKVKM